MGHQVGEQAWLKSYMPPTLTTSYSGLACKFDIIRSNLSNMGIVSSLYLEIIDSQPGMSRYDGLVILKLPVLANCCAA